MVPSDYLSIKTAHSCENAALIEIIAFPTHKIKKESQPIKRKLMKLRSHSVFLLSLSAALLKSKVTIKDIELFFLVTSIGEIRFYYLVGLQRCLHLFRNF